MLKPSKALSEHFGLKLTRAWKQWFDDESARLALQGCFRFPVNSAVLCESRPAPIWAGFMQPDTLPLIGNGYGDWICVRVTKDDELGELIHWYHGGGDWVPVGYSIHEAILHDWIDRFRPAQKQMLRGAAESIEVNISTEAADASEEACGLMEWLQAGLTKSHRGIEVANLLDLARRGGYAEALEQLVKIGISSSASACDYLELLIRRALPDENQSLDELPADQWKRIEPLCASVIRHRCDLGWAYALAGRAMQVRGKQNLALKTYFRGRLASAFSDQSVRLRIHRFDERFGKYGLAQLAGQRANLTASMLEDEYLQVVISSTRENVQTNVERFWQRQASGAVDKGKFAKAYNFTFRSGWDLGAARLVHFRSLLDMLADSASRAGWAARAQVAQAHLRCL